VPVKDDLDFTSSSSPLAKCAVIRTTPEKRKQNIAEATVAWLLDDGTDPKHLGLTHTQRKYTEKLFKGLIHNVSTQKNCSKD
jgi:hypothetical protein